jgi:hypothetical protein
VRPIGVAMVFCLSAYGLAQGLSGSASSSSSGNGVVTIGGSGPIIGGGRGPARGPLGLGSFQITMRVDPPSGSSPQGLSTSYHGRASPGKSYFKRTVEDGVNHECFGYEVLLVEQQSGTYLATFGKSPLTSMEASASAAGNAQWSIRPIVLPEPRIVHDGDVIAIELMTDTTGAKLIEDLTVQQYNPRASIGSPLIRSGGPRQLSDRAVPTVEGSPRAFSAADAEMRLTQPRVTLNGTVQPTAGRTTPNATGNLVWFYIPGRGR